MTRKKQLVRAFYWNCGLGKKRCNIFQAQHYCCCVQCSFLKFTPPEHYALA